MRNFLKPGTETNLAKIFTNIAKKAFLCSSFAYMSFRPRDVYFESELRNLEEVWLIFWIFVCISAGWIRPILID